MKITTIKTVNFLEVLTELQREEEKELGLAEAMPGTRITLPDGRDSVRQRVWDLVSSSCYGNQEFNNDSLFRFAFSFANGEAFLNDDERKLYEAIKDAVDSEGIVVFDVCW